MKFTAILVAAVALASGVAAKDCCCAIAPGAFCDCVSGYTNDANCPAVCTVRGGITC